MAVKVELQNVSKSGVVTVVVQDLNGAQSTKQLGPGQKTSTFVKAAGNSAAFNPTFTEVIAATNFGPNDQPN